MPMLQESMDTEALRRAVALSADRLLADWGPRRPRLALVLGSGWGALAEGLEDPMDRSYADLPAFPRLAIHGHAGRVRLGRLPGSDVEVMVLMGRQHAYEHGQADAMRGAVLTVQAVGCDAVILTNAAGAVRTEGPQALQTGDLMLLSDHLNLAQRSPLVNWSHGNRFVDMAHAYDPQLRAVARAAAQAMAQEPGERVLQEGIYAWVLGPQFETPAEVRMVRQLGADAVGMSTVPETIMARHAGLRVLGLSLMTNLAAGLSSEALSHAHTLAGASAHEGRARAVLERVIRAVDGELRTERARMALRCLDLTSLNDDDTPETIAALCAKALGPAGRPAAVCVWPRFVAQARAALPADVGVAAVVNFPSGDEPVETVVAQSRAVVADGASEVDLVLPWKALMAEPPDAVARDAAATLVRAVRTAVPTATLKLIIESGALHTPERIAQACAIGLEAGVDFLKTSTGKHATGATPEAATAMLQCIAAQGPAALAVGFKASGGVRTVDEAGRYAALVRQHLGPEAVGPARLRFGASGLLGDIERQLLRSGQGSGDASAGGDASSAAAARY